MPRKEWSFFLPAEDHKQVKWFLAYCHSRLTPWGQIILTVSVVGMAISSVGTMISAYLLPSFILALTLTSYFFSLFFRPRVEAYRLLPPAPRAGGHYAYKVIITNKGKRPLRNLAVFEQLLPYGLYPALAHPDVSNAVDWLEPGKQAVLTLVMRTPRRGTFELPFLVAGSSFPSGFLRSTRRCGKREKFIVYPKAIKAAEAVTALQRKFQPGGISLSSKVGDSHEFASTREYRPGDRVRDVHWASTARSGKIIVKEYVEEYFIRIGLFLDTELGRFEPHRYFESRISLCAGIAEELKTKDYVIDLFLSTPRAEHLQIGRHIDQFNHLLEFLAGIEGDRRGDFLEAAARVREHAPQLSFLFLFLKDWDRKRQELVKTLQDSGTNLRCIIVRDRPCSLPVKDDDVSVYTPQQLASR